MAINHGNRPVIIDTDVVGLDPHNGAEFVVDLVYNEGSLASPRRHKEPQVREARCEGPWDIPESRIGDEVLVEV